MRHDKEEIRSLRVRAKANGHKIRDLGHKMKEAEHKFEVDKALMERETYSMQLGTANTSFVRDMRL